VLVGWGETCAIWTPGRALEARSATCPQASVPVLRETVASNLQFGEARRDRRRDVGRRWRFAQAANFVRDMPGGLKRPHRAGAGTNVSGRATAAVLSIARALIRKPDIYVVRRFHSPRSTSPPTRDCAPRWGPVHPRLRGGDRRASESPTISTADNIVVLEDGDGHRRRNPRGVAREQRDLCRDRAVPDRRERTRA